MEGHVIHPMSQAGKRPIFDRDLLVMSQVRPTVVRMVSNKGPVRSSLRPGSASPRLRYVRATAAVLIGTMSIISTAGAAPATPQIDAAPTADTQAELLAIPYSTSKHVAPVQARSAVKVLKRAALVKQVKVMRSTIIKVAKQQIGDPYVAGANGPNGFDCGGLAQYVYRKATGIDILRSSRQQYTQVTKISKKNAKPGDLVFFFERGAHHVGIYIGNGKMIDAPGRGHKVRVSPISGSWWSRTYTGMGRVLPNV